MVAHLSFILIIFSGTTAFAQSSICDKKDNLKDVVKTAEATCGQRNEKCQPLPETLRRFAVRVFSKDCPNLAPLADNLSKSLSRFEQEFGHVTGPMMVNVESGMTTGFSIEENVINFPRADRLNKWINSADIITHEAFHLLKCTKFPKFCETLQGKQDSEQHAIAEALGDYFAYTMNQDTCFGEDFYKDKKCIRSYQTDLDYSLVEGSHKKGNVIVNYLIKNKVPWSDIKKFLESGKFTVDQLIPAKDHEQFGLTGEPPSFKITTKAIGQRPKIKSFDIGENSKGEISFEFNQSLKAKYPDAKIKFVELETLSGQSPTILISEVPAGQFSIATTTRGYKKLLLQIESSGKIVGEQRVFISVK